MDGTLCDVRSIRAFVEKGREFDSAGRRNFHAFHSASIDCPANPQVTKLVARFNRINVSVIIVSAREAKWGFLTALWLSEQTVQYEDMYLRPDGDYRPDHEIKADMAAIIGRKYDVILAIDDRDDVLTVWRAHAIPTIRVMRDGTLEARVMPTGQSIAELLAALGTD